MDNKEIAQIDEFFRGLGVTIATSGYAEEAPVKSHNVTIIPTEKDKTDEQH